MGTDDDQADQLEYFVSGLPFGSGITLFSTGILKGTPSMADAMSAQPLEITILASDGKASTQESFEVTIQPEELQEEGEDTEDPTIECPEAPEGGNILTVMVPPGQTSTIWTYALPKAADNRAGAKLELVQGQMSGESFDLGTHSITWRVTDAVGLTQECSFTVLVLQQSETEDLEVGFTLGESVEMPTASSFGAAGGLAFSIEGLASGSGLNIDGASGVVYGVPNPFDLGITEAMIVGTQGDEVLRVALYITVARP